MTHRTSAEMTFDLAKAAQKWPINGILAHKKGGRYSIVGHEIDAEDGMVRIQYRRVGGPEFNAVDESSIIFSRRLEEFTFDRFTFLWTPAT